MTEIQQQFQFIVQNIRICEEQLQEISQKILEQKTALKELEKSENSYKIIGTILVEKSPDVLILEITEKTQTLTKTQAQIQNQLTQLKKQKEEIEQKLKGE